MDNLEKYNQAFIGAFDISNDVLEELKYEDIDAWDSIGHMGLIEALEGAFKITLDIDDIIGLSSYKKGKEILKKYGVEIE